MDMPDVGLAVSGTALGVIGTIVTAWLKARACGNKGSNSGPRRVEVTPDPLRVEFLEQYATKRDLRELEERWERRITQSIGEIRQDVIGFRRDMKDYNEAAEARSIATHKRIDAMKDFCMKRLGGC
jgi:hypothetical protein